MACIRKRRGKYVVDYRDALGVRRWVTCDTRRDADAALERAIGETRGPRRSAVDPEITVRAYAEHWLTVAGPTLKHRTLEGYGDLLRLHVVPALGELKVRRLDRGRLKVL